MSIIGIDYGSLNITVGAAAGMGGGQTRGGADARAGGEAARRGEDEQGGVWHLLGRGGRRCGVARKASVTVGTA